MPWQHCRGQRVRGAVYALTRTWAGHQNYWLKNKKTKEDILPLQKQSVLQEITRDI